MTDSPFNTVIPDMAELDVPDLSEIKLPPDNVDHPKHYTQASIEAIDYLEMTLGEGFEFFLEGNVKKYMHRWRYKNGLEDLRKAQWYLQKLIDTIEGMKNAG